MDINTIKKELYKTKPKAIQISRKDGLAIYTTQITIPPLRGFTTIHFEVPESDMGDAKFLPEMEAQFLIRWLKPEIE